MKLPPQIGERIVIGDWIQFPTTVTYIEALPDKRVCIYVTTKYPDDPMFRTGSDTSKVYLHEEGDTWHRYNAHPGLN